MRSREIVQDVLKRTGYILTRWPVEQPEETLRRNLERVLEDMAIETVLDVGAHVGDYGQLLRTIGFEGQICSFEPSPRPFSVLRARTDQRWSATNIALGDTEGAAELYDYSEHEVFASLRKPSSFGSDLYGLTVRQTFDVRVRRLDDVCAELGIDPIRTYLKIDTQGHDAAVLDGGESTLAKIAGLQLELPMFGIYEGAPSATRLIDRVRAAGLELVGMFPVHDDPRPLIPVEFDALFARSTAIG
ncbi:MAG: FkbM family methyltransferase [Actinomycetes bacterium]